MSFRYFKLYFFSILLFACLTTALKAQTIVPDSLLREQLTRAVQVWQTGKAVIAYQTLDSIIAQPISAENAATKVKAATWTATYLQQQKKIKPASKFLDSALTWAAQFNRAEELKKVYDAYAQFHLATGNPKAALAAQQASFQIKDSLTQATNQQRIDSLNTTISKLQSEKAAEAIVVKEEPAEPVSSVGMLQYILIAAVVLLLLIIISLSSKLNKLKSSAPASYSSKPVKENVPAKVMEKPAEVKKEKAEIVQEEKIIVKTNDAPAGKDSSKEILALTARISAVELVLIRSDVFAWKVNGDSKTAHKTLQKYVDDFPVIMKSLDDAIALNDVPAILKALNELNAPLEAFGMSGTLKWIKEIEEESKTEKVNKLLSRVFQVRNHARRALDEAKAILEKVSL